MGVEALFGHAPVVMPGAYAHADAGAVCVTVCTCVHVTHACAILQHADT